MRNIIIAVMAVMLLAFSGSAMAASGASLFKSKCSACHGAKAQGGPMAPQLAGSAFIKGPADAIKSTIMDGRSGGAKKYKKFPMAMPKLGIKTKDADELVKYLKSL
jgi:mono/diheme cytochrome c family protein